MCKNCNPVANPTEPIGEKTFIEDRLDLFTPDWWPYDKANLYRCPSCGRIYQVFFDHYNAWYESRVLTAAATKLASGPCTIGGTISSAASAGDAFDDVTDAAAYWVRKELPQSLEGAVDKVLRRLERCRAGAVEGLVRLFAKWAIACIEDNTVSKNSDIVDEKDKDDLNARFFRLMEQAAESRKIAVAASGPENASLRIQSLEACYQAIKRVLEKENAGLKRAERRLKLLKSLHDLLAKCHAPRYRGALWMPGEEWQRLYNIAGREGRIRRNVEKLRNLLDGRPSDPDGLIEITHLLAQLYSPDKVAGVEDLQLFERAAAYAKALPTSRSISWGDPVLTLRYEMEKLLERARGEGPFVDPVDP